MSKASIKNPTDRKAYIITGPTSGIGRLTALELAKQGTVILVGRHRKKLDEVQKTVERKGQHAVSVVCDLSDIFSVRRAAAEIIGLDLPIAGLLNNAGIMAMRPGKKSAQGWDMTFATNYLGPFALTEALVPHLPDGAHVAFVASGVEDPERKPAKIAGFRGGRFISVEASARGDWQPGGSTMPGADAYATSKQCVLAAAMAFARETQRLRFNAIEPGFTPNTGLARDTNVFLRFLANYLLPLLAPHIKYWSTPKRASRLETKVLIDSSGQAGVYYDERGEPMLGSVLVRDPKFQDRVVAETRALLSTIPAGTRRLGPANTYIVTGGNACLGLACVSALGKDGSTLVIIACRNVDQGEQAAQRVRAAGGNVAVLPLDLAKQASVHSFVTLFRERQFPPLVGIVCNAGGQNVAAPTKTDEGYETTFAVNHLGHYLLTRLLLPDLAHDARITFVSSGTHDPEQKTGMPASRYTTAEAVAHDFEPGGNAGRRRYTTSKLCNVLCTYEYARRFAASTDQRLQSLRVNAFDPGLMPATSLARTYSPPLRFVARYILPLLSPFVGNIHSPATSGRRLALLVSGSEGSTTGKYFSDGREVPSSKESYDTQTALDLWNASAKMTGLTSELSRGT